MTPKKVRAWAAVTPSGEIVREVGTEHLAIFLNYSYADLNYGQWGNSWKVVEVEVRVLPRPKDAHKPSKKRGTK